MCDKEYHRTGKNDTADDEILLIFDGIPGIRIGYRPFSRRALPQLLPEAEVKISNGKHQGDQCNITCVCNKIAEGISQ